MKPQNMRPGQLTQVFDDLQHSFLCACYNLENNDGELQNQMTTRKQSEVEMIKGNLMFCERPGLRNYQNITQVS